MIFSRSTQYAIQALVLIAGQPAGHPIQSRVIAQRLKLPVPYLGKLLMQFAHAGLVEGTRGRQGGYRLNCDPKKINLLQVADVVSAGHVTQDCLLGLKACGDEDACAMHCQWKPVKQQLFALLEEQNLARLAQAVARGRYRLEDINVGRLVAGMADAQQ
jgi:Rrf2 family protein